MPTTGLSVALFRPWDRRENARVGAAERVRTPLRREADRERGATLVEFALILPVFMALVLGMFTGGLAYNRKISMTNAVREGSRFGATLEQSTDWANTVRSRTVELSGGDLTEDQVCAKLVTITVTGEDTVVENSSPSCSLSGEPSAPSGADVDTCLAKVWAQRNSEFQALFFTVDLTLNAKSVNRYERDCSP